MNSPRIHIPLSPTSPRHNILPYDTYLKRILSSDNLTVKDVNTDSYRLLYFKMRFLFTASSSDENNRLDDKLHLWGVLVEQHSDLLIRHLDRLEKLMTKYRSQQDCYSDIRMDTFRTYFETTCMNLETLLSGVYYNASIVADDQRKFSWREGTSEKEEGVPSLQRAVSTYSPSSQAMRIPPPSPSSEIHSQKPRKRTKKNQAKKEVEDKTASPIVQSVSLFDHDHVLNITDEQVALQNKTRYIIQEKYWVRISSDSIAQAEQEIKRQREYSLMCDGNYSYEVFDRLTKDVRNVLKDPKQTYRQGLDAMLKIEMEAASEVPDYQIVNEAGHTGWWIYHFTELVIIPTLVLAVKPNDLFTPQINFIFDSIFIGITIIFLLFGLRRLKEKKEQNVAALTMCARKYFLTKCMYLALLIRVGMIVDLLVPVPPKKLAVPDLDLGKSVMTLKEVSVKEQITDINLKLEQILNKLSEKSSHSSASTSNPSTPSSATSPHSTQARQSSLSSLQASKPTSVLHEQSPKALVSPTNSSGSLSREKSFRTSPIPSTTTSNPSTPTSNVTPPHSARALQSIFGLPTGKQSTIHHALSSQSLVSSQPLLSPTNSSAPLNSEKSLRSSPIPSTSTSTTSPSTPSSATSPHSAQAQQQISSTLQTAKQTPIPRTQSSQSLVSPPLLSPTNSSASSTAEAKKQLQSADQKKK